MAGLASRREGKPNSTIEDLIASGLLPEGFGRRPDGSSTVLLNRETVDFLRGARRAFLPIPDVPVRGVTRGEMNDYQKRAAHYGEHWKRLDPVMVGINRFAPKEPGRERLTKADEWYLAVQVEFEIDEPGRHPGKPVGIDAGVTQNFTLSTGKVFDLPRKRLDDLQKRIVRQQRILSRRWSGKPKKGHKG